MYFKDYNIFKSGGTNNYRIPSILVDNDGTVIAFCNNRKSSIEDHAPEVDLVCCIRDVESANGERALQFQLRKALRVQ